jgi:AcrR family transcriptional regulator
MPNSNATRARILAAGRERLETRSARFVSLREIAADADVSAALIVQMFGSKDELVFEVRLQQVETEIRQDLAAARLAGSGAQPLFAFFDSRIARRMASPWVIKDIQDNAWQWSGDQHARFERMFHPVGDLLAAVMGELSRNTERAPGMSIEHFGTLARMTCESILHRAFSFNLPVEKAQQKMRSALRGLLQACVAGEAPAVAGLHLAHAGERA